MNEYIECVKLHIVVSQLKSLRTSALRYSEPGSSVSTVSGYRLDDRAIEVRSPAEAKGFFLYPLCPDRL
jgi:hypothetical protein